uniref:Proactivator polypeptide n=1 Tax=Melanoplus sanguinipes TaxID=65742 RepID=A0A0U3TC83_MELSA|nr:proactivator polypeptide [Melanoplus sanguinipes]
MRVVILCLLICVSMISAHPPVSIYLNEDARQCSRGPVYWCDNLRNAKACQAVKHCIQTVWQYKVLPEDNDDVCKICKDMVAEARAQLQSNETQEELKEVFEGTCALIPLKPVAKECMKLADEFVPELVETLASQMNPQVVCAVAGLCNNAQIDQLLAEKNEGKPQNEVKNCDNCYNVTELLRKKFHETPRDDILNNVLEACGKLGSFSDSCAAIAVTYFDNWYNHLHKYLISEEVCHFAGMCSYKFHEHRQDSVELTIESSVGVVAGEKDDLPCDFCEQLVIHLRDVLVANTTEAEFQMVLRGLCKQTGSFAEECLSVVDEYYGVIYNFLVQSLVPKEVCSTLGLCPHSGNAGKGPIWPLLPVKTANRLQYSTADDEPVIVPLTPLQPAQLIIGQDEANSYKTLHHVPLTKNDVKVSHVELDQLPIDRMVLQTANTVQNRQLCEFCELFLHYVQQVLTTPSTEAQIERVVKKACSELPKEFEDQCRDFVQNYGDAAIAILAQEIDPSQVCPRLGICPSEKALIDLSNVVYDKPSCPLCLLAVQDLQNTLKNNRTEASIKQALEGLCSKLSKSLAAECEKFVEDYSDELVDMLVADFTPQEVCAYLKLCDPSPKPVIDISSNEIPSSSKHHLMPQDIIHSEIDKFRGEACVICEFVLTKIQERLKDKPTEDEIKTIVHDICNYMPQTVAKECNDFVNQYADLVITLLSETMDPQAVCTAIKLCSSTSLLKGTVTDCAVCDAALGELKKLEGGSYTHKNISELVKRICDSVPVTYTEQCKQLVDIYGPSIVNLRKQDKEYHEICEMIGKCPRHRQVTNLLGGEKCTWGPSYWCQSEEHATACGAKLHCQENVWNGDTPVVN